MELMEIDKAGSKIRKRVRKTILDFIRRKNICKADPFFRNKKGIEIGGPSPFFYKKGPFPIYHKVLSLDCVNFSQSTVWTGEIDAQQGYMIDGRQLGQQFFFDAVELESIPNESYDFLLSCNNIEHFANPLKAVEQWVQKIKSGGTLLIVAPRKDFTFDHKRKVVKFEHLLQDYESKITEDDLTHLEEILKLHDLELDPLAGTLEQFRERSLKNFENRCLHQHVFDLAVLQEIMNYFHLSVHSKFEQDENYFILSKKS